MKNGILGLVCFLLVFACAKASAQSESVATKTELLQKNWLTNQVALPFYSETLREGYKYVAFMYAPRWDAFTIFSGQKLRLIGSVEPQLVIVPDVPETELEAGVNLAFSFLFAAHERVLLRASVGAGPHFITAETRSQARGFIFSDNFELGAHLLSKRNRSGGPYLGVRFRHISNANFEKPNVGIDHFFAMVGYAISLNR